MRSVGLGLVIGAFGLGCAIPEPGGRHVPVAVALTEGSRLVGCADLSQVALRSEALGRLAVRGDKIRSITLKDAAGTAQIALANGDTMHGVLELPALRVTGSFGSVRIDRQFIRTVTRQSSAGAAPEFEVLPFAANSEWPAGRGAPAVVGPETIVLHGQPIRTRGTYSLPVTLECDVSFDGTTPRNGEFLVFFVPPGSARDREPVPSAVFWLRSMDVDQDGGPHRLLLGNFGDLLRDFREAWRGRPFYLKPGQNNHLSLTCAATETRIAFGDQEYTVPNVTVPYDKFQIQIQGWIPDHRWELRNVIVR